MALLLALTLLLPQQPTATSPQPAAATQPAMAAARAAAAPRHPPADAALVSGVLRDATLPLSAFGLGDGGVGAKAAAPLADPARLAPGQWLTPGGVLVRVQHAGVKLDFPAKSELLCTPNGRIWLRSGESTLATFGPFELWLADDTRLRIVPAPGGAPPLERVELLCPEGVIALWSRGVPLAQPAQPSAVAAPALLALGDGSVLYRAVPMGPVVVLQRALCAAVLADQHPTTKVVVLGDVLAASLQRLPRHAPPKTVDAPSVLDLAQMIAAAAPELFAAGVVARRVGSRGALDFPLAGDFWLKLRVQGDAAPVTLGLYRGELEVPTVEWTVGLRTELHFVRPGGGLDGGPRWFLSGIDCSDLLPATRLAPRLVDVQQARRTLSTLGGGGAILPVERVGGG